MSTVTKSPIVYCNNLEDFVTYIENKRDIKNEVLKFGIDEGGGFLKICLSIQVQEENEFTDEGKNRKRQKLSDGVCAKAFKDSRVKKLFILDIAKYAQENYENAVELWKLLK